MKLTHPLLSPFEIDADSDQYTLVRIGTVAAGPKQGDRTETTIGYYTSLEHCLRKVVKEQLLAENATMGLEEFVTQTIDRLNQVTALKLAA